MNHESPKPIKRQIEEQGADSAYVRNASIANKLEDTEYATDPTVLMRRRSGDLQPARLTGNVKKVEDDKREHEVMFHVGEQQARKWLPEAHLTDEVQQKRAAELAGKALRGVGVEKVINGEVEDGETFLAKDPEAAHENTEEMKEYTPGEFAGRLYDFKRDYIQAAHEADGRAKRSLEAIGELTEMLDKISQVDADEKNTFVGRARDEFTTIRSDAQSEIADADTMRRDAGSLYELADDDTMREALYALASDVSSGLREAGETTSGYASRLLRTLDELEAGRDGNDYTQLLSDIQGLQTELSNSQDIWGGIENRLDDLTR